MILEKLFSVPRNTPASKMVLFCRYNNSDVFVHLTNTAVVIIFPKSLLMVTYLMPNLGGIEPEKLHRVTLGLEITDAPDVMNSNLKFDVSLYGTLIPVSHKESKCLCCNSRCTNLSSQSTERERERERENISFLAIAIILT